MASDHLGVLGGGAGEVKGLSRRGLRPLGLRGRVTAAFAGGALLLSASLAVITYATARHDVPSQRHLALILGGAAAAITLAGAILGRWVSGRALQPLGVVSAVAESIAGGHLDTRLDGRGGPDLAKLAASFNRMADNLQDRIQREARFASDVSHELRSPLTTLTTSVAVLESRREELSERSRRAVDLLASDVVRFQRLVTDLLEISRFDLGAATLSLDEVGVAELVDKAAGSWEHPRLTVSDGACDLRVTVDKRRMERVIGNLVENASVYGGGVSGLCVETADGIFRIVVDDDGPGVAPEERQRVFERFSRGATAGSRSGSEGAGLGLSLVSEHVRLHGGRVWVEESPGGGARFVVELPVCER